MSDTSCRDRRRFRWWFPIVFAALVLGAAVFGHLVIYAEIVVPRLPEFRLRLPAHWRMAMFGPLTAVLFLAGVCARSWREGLSAALLSTLGLTGWAFVCRDRCLPGFCHDMEPGHGADALLAVALVLGAYVLLCGATGATASIWRTNHSIGRLG